jgi:hypothetical protein
MLFSERDGFAAKTRENQRRCVDATTAAVSGRPGEVEVEMACMDADVDYDDVRCPRRVVVANLASEWYDVRVLSFVWI